MKRKLSAWQFSGFAFTALIGTLLHFLYDWTHRSIAAAVFSAVNESTWEHMKLLFFPMFVFAFIQHIFFKDYKAFWCIKFLGILTGLALIPILFYTYNGVFGKSPDTVNIMIFFISAAGAFVLEMLLFKKECLHCKNPYLPFAAICLIAVLFMIFTFYTPRIPLFRDPIDGTYGITKVGLPL